MTAISTSEHKKIIELVNAKTAEYPIDESLHKDTLQLQQLYTHYQNKISALKHLIREYETLQRRLKVKLRKHPIPVKQKEDEVVLRGQI